LYCCAYIIFYVSDNLSPYTLAHRDKTENKPRFTKQTIAKANNNKRIKFNES